jgi:hypothetical protein
MFMNQRSPRGAIESYIRAKDQNRPHLMPLAFAEHSTLDMEVKTGAISFPAHSRGRDAITEVLVRNFAQHFENVYTFCLSSPPADDQRDFSCKWLVGMAERSTGSIRIGCGSYDWRFQSQDTGSLVERLRITIEFMQVFSSDKSHILFRWLARLPYPWCPRQTAAGSAPSIDELSPIIDYVAAA